ncbi:hypothetical protein BDN72DRAFT_834818 [Pluteus cervinus]|uniref:Uncharacterized protein n=1 Tax=Pluteus cervinus TaxID=181527 RepID=A0ACD3B6G2_9AGAR|nr:hypothetical protein BDN72DRAFT_834818 [Pluteus cervinus]
MMRQAAFPRSGILVLGANSIQSLVPATLISQVESLLGSHRVEDALTLAEQQRKKLQANHIVNEDEADELRYVFQRIGFQCFVETLFEDAGKCFFSGELDPRLLVSFFPELRGEFFSPTNSIDMFSGVAENMPTDDSVDDIISMNLVRNYSPHLSPSTRASPPTAELMKILSGAAREMLEVFLRRCQSRYRAHQKLGISVDRKGKTKDNAVPVDEQGLISTAALVDTVLAKLYALSEKTNLLYDLLSSPASFIVVSELEEVLRHTGQYCALCMLYKNHGETTGVVNRGKILGVLAKLVDGEWSDDDVKDPLSEMVALLSEKTKDREGDRALLRRWVVWIIGRDAERGLQLLISDRTKESGKRRGTVSRKREEEEDIALLDEIAQANEEAGQRWLEFMVIKRRSSNPSLHSRLALSCIDRLTAILKDDDAIEKLWRAKSSSYASTFPAAPLSSVRLMPSSPTRSQHQPPPQSQSFLTYFASTTPDSPSKRLRLKSILFLAGSSHYDPAEAKRRLLATGALEDEKEDLSASVKGKGKAKKRSLLGLELAILEGKLSNHQDALTILVHEVNDAYSAEAYCSLGGEVVPRKVAIAVGEGCQGLDGWTEVLFGAPSSTNGLAPPPLKRQPSSTSQTSHLNEIRSDLLKTLLGVYMRDEEVSAGRAAHLLNSQAVNLDVPDVIDLVPPNWPVESMTSFLARSFRRTLHASHEGLIVKHLSMGQNLAVKERTWYTLREEGMLVEEAASDDEGDDEEEVLDEKAALVDNVALGGFEPGTSTDEKNGIRPGHDFHNNDGIYIS